MRIREIEICDFRGFPGPAIYRFNLGAEGKNLLVYGENGSGKSTLFHALREFFNARGNAQPFSGFKNAFTDPALTAGQVKVTFTQPPATPAGAGTVYPWVLGGNRPAAHFADTASFLDYRAVLRTSFGARRLERQLFYVAAEHLFSPLSYSAAGTQRSLRDYWKDVTEPMAEVADIRRRREAGEDPAAIPSQPYSKVIAALNAYNTAVLAVRDALRDQANELLEAHFNDTKLRITSLDYGSATFSRAKNRLENEHLRLELEFNGRPVTRHHEFLNEARLSSLALALYFGALLLGNPPPPAGAAAPFRLLVLDDLLIGLDHAHRQPVLDLLLARFPHFQLILLTHDRVWHEIARLQLPDREWTSEELFTQQVTASYDTPVLRPSKGDLLDIAAKHLNPPGHDLRAAAVYARMAFETKVKKFCEKLQLRIAYHTDARQVSSNKYWEAAKETLRVEGKIGGKRKEFYPNEAAVLRIEMFRKVVLNELSHATLNSVNEQEVRGAIAAVRDLRLAEQPPLDAAAAFALKPFDAHIATAWVCALRAAFDRALRAFCEKENVAMPFALDSWKHTPQQLWDAAKPTLAAKPTIGTLIADIETHPTIFLAPLEFAVVSVIPKATLQAANAVLEAPPVNTTKLTKVDALP